MVRKGTHHNSHFKSSYIRAKRDTQTVFLYYEPTDTVKHIVEKLAKIVKKPVDEVRFVLNDVPVDESKTCTAASFQSDGVVYFVYREGSVLLFFSFLSISGANWEAVKVPKIEYDLQ